MPEARIDKWMWAARIFKTRNHCCRSLQKRKNLDQRFSGETCPNGETRGRGTGQKASCNLFLQGATGH